MNEHLNNTNLKNLTTREKEILNYLIKGLHNSEIAQNLGISFHTVKAHISSILHKLGVNTRTAAVRMAILEIMNNDEKKKKNKN